jgi:glutamate-1-semialdehyde aminotransferase
MAPVLVRGHGARVWDADGNSFVEYGIGLRSVTLGHGYRPVLGAVRAVLDDGLSFTRPTTLELAAAEDFLAGARQLCDAHGVVLVFDARPAWCSSPAARTAPPRRPFGTFSVRIAAPGRARAVLRDLGRAYR